MANSSIVSKAKNIVIKELIKDIDIITAIDSSRIPIDKPEQLLYTHIFDYQLNPYKINDVGTFLNILVNVADYMKDNEVFSKVIIDIEIISHFRHMRIDNIPKVNMNRNDYLSRLIVNKFNNNSSIGLGKLTQKTNIEGRLEDDYLFRRITFETIDLNKSFCDEE